VLVTWLVVCGGCSEGTLSGAMPRGSGAAGASADAGGSGAGGAGGVQEIGACPAATCGNSCTGLPPCRKTCGPARSGYRDCACDAATQMWACTGCNFDPVNDYSCFKLPDPVPACPPDGTDPSGAQLPLAASPCTLAPCQPCGSSTAPGYRDSTGAPKVGFCICVPSGQPGQGGVYSCASVADWPAQVAASSDDELIEC